MYTLLVYIYDEVVVDLLQLATHSLWAVDIVLQTNLKRDNSNISVTDCLHASNESLTLSLASAVPFEILLPRFLIFVFDLCLEAQTAAFFPISDGRSQGRTSFVSTNWFNLRKHPAPAVVPSACCNPAPVLNRPPASSSCNSCAVSLTIDLSHMLLCFYLRSHPCRNKSDA